MLTWASEVSTEELLVLCFGDCDGGEVAFVNSSNHSRSPVASSKVNLKLSGEE